MSQYSINKRIQKVIDREASIIHLYNRLAEQVPEERHHNEIHNTLVSKKAHLKQLITLYRTYTGEQPEYRIHEIPFHRYEEGLQKAYHEEMDAFHEFREILSDVQDPVSRRLLMSILHDHEEYVSRCRFLYQNRPFEIRDYGGEPFVVDIEEATTQNDTYRTALWTGERLQVTLMSIDVDDDIGLEVHPKTDQFLRIEQGQGLVQMGPEKEQLDFEEMAYEDYAIMIPAGTWHNVTNTGSIPMRIYAIYAPPEHPYGTVHETKADAMAAEENG